MTFGTKIGNTIGTAAAYAAHGAIASAKYTGQFGQDIVAGTQAGYRTKADELAAQRALGYKPTLNRAAVKRVVVKAKA